MYPSDNLPFGEATQCVHGAVLPEPRYGAILTPIYQSSVFVQESIETYLSKGHSYSGSANPSVDVLEEKIALLERAAAALCFNSGMAAIASTLAAFLQQGDHCIVSHACYATTQELLMEIFAELGVEVSFVDFRYPSKIEQAIETNTKLFFIEYPTNPTLYLTDLETVVGLAKSRGIKCICDSTLATPMIIRPVDYGIDIVIQSTTKYYDGHNMTIGGAVALACIEDRVKIFKNRSRFGGMMSPMVAFLTLQAVKTMSLRVREQSKNAQCVAQFLDTHPKVAEVFYPGLASFPQKELADKQHRDGLHGGIIFFNIQGGDEDRKKFMRSLYCPWSLGANLGAVESLVSCPNVMSNGNMSKEQLASIGISAQAVRLSCGIEHSQDLIGALERTLDQI